MCQQVIKSNLFFNNLILKKKSALQNHLCVHSLHKKIFFLVQTRFFKMSTQFWKYFILLIEYISTYTTLYSQCTDTNSIHKNNWYKIILLNEIWPLETYSSHDWISIFETKNSLYWILHWLEVKQIKLIFYSTLIILG